MSENKYDLRKRERLREQRIDRLFFWTISLIAGCAALCYMCVGILQMYVAYRAMIGQPVD